MLGLTVPWEALHAPHSTSHSESSDCEESTSHRHKKPRHSLGTGAPGLVAVVFSSPVTKLADSTFKPVVRPYGQGAAFNNWDHPGRRGPARSEAIERELGRRETKAKQKRINRIGDLPATGRLRSLRTQGAAEARIEDLFVAGC
jgi:hypothetical protein